MKLENFDFDLPKELIAYHPISPRDHSKMLHINNLSLSDDYFYNIVNYLRAGDLLILNNTMVIKACLKACSEKNLNIELNLHKQIDDKTWKAFAKKTKKMRVDDKFFVSSDFFFTITNIDQGEIEIIFNKPNSLHYIQAYGQVPIPPYIKRESEVIDEKDYQTVYAQVLGSVAAPTAGLHFTDEIFAQLKEKNINTRFVTLNIGAGTFLPVKTDIITDHKMHSEYYSIAPEVIEQIIETKKNGHRVICVGTTSLRAIESAFSHDPPSLSNDTDIFIYPGYKFKVVDALLTNFHLPKSTLFMLVCAFCGTDTMRRAYQHAIDNNYRFFSYGDCCFLERDNNGI
jgi:S-adenosylmethionine:tRNA ribosyltransferase-isomerase